ncbi:MAG: dihydroorotate dehydrogenase [Chlorobiaceae bacterium]|nr:dihydroorotate dehydrogenase [Chlorobiaceae bacterium]
MIDTTVNIGSMRLKNPVLVASGTFGYGDETLELVDVSKLGGIVTKSLTLKPRDGNLPPRIVETACGMLNSIGLANIGVKNFIEEKLPLLRELNTSIIVNIAGNTIEEYEELLTVLEDQSGIDAYEINVSCPNVKEGGLAFGTKCNTTAEITRRVRKLTAKPIIIKLTPNVTRISEFAVAVEAEGADAVSVMNTLVGIAVDVKTQKPKLSTVTGGLSGPAIKPVALAKVYEVFKSVKIPIIGLGGIMNWADAIEFMLIGAKAVQVGTANFIDPAIGIKIADGIKQYCVDRRIAHVVELVGALKI